MKTILALIMALVVVPGSGARAGSASQADRAAAARVVQAFFTAMKAGDVNAIRGLYQPNTQFVWSRPTKDGQAIEQQSIESFMLEVKQAPDGFLERIWAPDVLVDGPVAMVWARYDFHRGRTFSHNGRDCYVLLNTSQGWKIVSLVFSVEPAARTENPAGPPP